VSVPPAIATSGLSKDYGSGRGLFDLDLQVRQGEVFGFLGPNGAGKSTTMRLLLDEIRSSSGSARVLGFDTRSESLEIRRRVGFLPGDFAMYPRLTGGAVLARTTIRRLLIRPNQRCVLLPRASGRDLAEPCAFVSDEARAPQPRAGTRSLTQRIAEVSALRPSARVRPTRKPQAGQPKALTMLRKQVPGRHALRRRDRRRGITPV
jgi:ABC-type dipeptide/oligopeptide/nickel transport system ATPase component